MTIYLTINDNRHEFIPIKVYRAAHALPDSFGVAHFEPKDYAGLGSMDGAGAALNDVRAVVLAHMDTLDIDRASPLAWLNAIPTLEATFERALIAVNDGIGLRPVEIGFAVAGFGDVCRAVAYEQIRARAVKSTLDFAAIYRGWLDSTVRVSQTVHAYAHGGAIWQVQIVTHAYGRAGLIVRRDTNVVDYVSDARIGCPAEGYMGSLLADVAARMG
jgi:hypothetical protein